MCGRYYIDDTTAREVEKAVGRLDGKLDMTCGDVLPFQGAAVLRNQRGRLTADVMTWGFPGIDKGKLLIKESTHTISEISAMLGFTSVHYFSRKFKQEYGITPSDYAKSIYN